MSKIIPSADITLLDFSVMIDLSEAAPVASVTNLSTVVNPANLKWMFEFISPSGNYLYQGNFTDPDVDGVAFTTFNFPDPIQQIFGQIEYSNQNKYIVNVYVQDDAGVIYDLSKGRSLCKPNGNTGEDNFGRAAIDLKVQCGQGAIVRDQTNLVYKSINGSRVSTDVTLSYPKDKEGNQLADVTLNSLPGMFTLRYEGNGHEIYVAHVFDYDLGDSFIVRIRYFFQQVFGVWCNVNLEPLFCEVSRIEEILGKDCNDSAEKREKYQKLTRANTKLLKAVVGIVQPLSGFDVPKIVEEVKTLLQIECDCCRPAGISNIGMALATDANFTHNITCGDITAAFTNDGNGNIVLNLGNKTYSFIMKDDAANSAAFSFSVAQTGCNKAVALMVEKLVLAEEILTEITNSPTLLNILNSITQRAVLNCSGLNGGSVMNLAACNYTAVINTGVTGSTFTNIVIGGTPYTAPGGTLVTDAGAIQTFLNSLAKGTFVVSYNSGTSRTTITSAANTNLLATVQILAGTPKTIGFGNDCGLICNILQGIFNYLGTLNLTQVKTGVGLTICRFNTDGTVDSKNFADTATASSVAAYMAASLCNVVNYIKDKLVTCANISALFATYTGTVGDPGVADEFYMLVNGKCQKMPLKNVGLSIVRSIRTDTDIRNEFCLIPPCSSVNNCAPVAGLTQGTGTDTTQNYSWSAVAGAVGYKWSINGTSYTSVTSTAAFISGLVANTSYTFRVYPVYAYGDGIACEVTDGFVTTDTGETCMAPENLVIDLVAATSFRATWDAVPGATGYQVSLQGGGWMNIGLVTTYSPTGLTPETLYNIIVAAVIGGARCPSGAGGSTTTAESPATNVYYSNTSADATVLSSTIAGAPFFTITTGAFPLGEGDNIEGEQAGVSGVLALNMGGGVFTATATLVVAGVFIECIDLVPGTGNVFGVRTYLVGESIEVTIADGTCGA